MDTAAFGDREDSVSRLQKARDIAQPGSKHEAVQERALDYVLSEGRTDVGLRFRVRAARRNAEFAHDRSTKRAKAAVKRLRAREGAPLAGIHTGRPGARTENRALGGSAPSAEDCALVTESDFCACVLEAAATVHAGAVEFVHCLMRGDTITEAARAAEMSRAAAYRLIATLRATVPRPTTAGIAT